MWNLPGDRDDRNAVQLRIRQSRHQVRRPGTTGRHTNANLARRPSNTLSRKATALFVARQNGSNMIAGIQQRLMHRHAGSAGISKDMLNTLTHKRLNENIRAVDCCLFGNWFSSRHWDLGSGIWDLGFSDINQDRRKRNAIEE